jgi:hypothetical protein
MVENCSISQSCALIPLLVSGEWNSRESSDHKTLIRLSKESNSATTMTLPHYIDHY